MAKGFTSPRTKVIGLRAKAWWVIRKNKSITMAELRLTICSGEEGNADGNLRKWINPLVLVGVLNRERVPDGIECSNGSYRYTLIQDLGPKAPVVRHKTEQVFNPNNGSVISFAKGSNDRFIPTGDGWQ